MFLALGVGHMSTDPTMFAGNTRRITTASQKTETFMGTMEIHTGHNTIEPLKKTTPSNKGTTKEVPEIMCTTTATLQGTAKSILVPIPRRIHGYTLYNVQIRCKPFNRHGYGCGLVVAVAVMVAVVCTEENCFSECNSKGMGWIPCPWAWPTHIQEPWSHGSC